LELLELKAKIRTTSGNGPARALRRTGKIPAVLYGPNTETLSLSVDQVAVQLALRNSSSGQALFNLVIQNGEKSSRSAMIKEMQTHPLSKNILHIDFYEIAMDQKVTVKIPVVTKGISKGVELGGMLQFIRRELEVLCLPGEIPDAIEIDITELDIGDSIHVQEIPLEGGIEIPADINFTVLTVLSPKVEEEPEEEVEEEAELATEEEEVAETGGEE
jgi:large subunit ribosomal protein L25